MVSIPTLGNRPPANVSTERLVRRKTTYPLNSHAGESSPATKDRPCTTAMALAVSIPTPGNRLLQLRRMSRLSGIPTGLNPRARESSPATHNEVMTVFTMNHVSQSSTSPATLETTLSIPLATCLNPHSRESVPSTTDQDQRRRSRVFHVSIPGRGNRLLQRAQRDRLVGRRTGVVSIPTPGNRRTPGRVVKTPSGWGQPTSDVTCSFFRTLRVLSSESREQDGISPIRLSSPLK